MSRNGDLMSAAKQGAGFKGFFSSEEKVSIDIPPQIKYEYMEMKDFIDNIDSKVKYAKNVNQEKLKNKVLVDLNRLNREERIVQKLEEKLAKQGIEVNESSMIKKDLSDLQSLEQFSNSLKKTGNNIQQQIEVCQQRINELKQKISEQKNHLRQTNSQIMEKSAQKETLIKSLKFYNKQDQFFGASSIIQNQNSNYFPFQSDFSSDDHYLTSVPEQMMSTQINNNSITTQNPNSIQFAQNGSSMIGHSHSISQNTFKYKKITVNASSGNIKTEGMGHFHKDEQFQRPNNIKKSQSSNTLPPLKHDPVAKMIVDVQKVKDINEEIKNFFLKKSNGFLEMKRVIYDCFASQRKRILKMHKISNHLGLADSMIFQMGDNNEQAKNSVFQQSKHITTLSQTLLQDRELKNVLYDTIKQIKAQKIVAGEQEQNQEMLFQNQISYDQFSEFTSDQLLSLLMVKPEILQQLLTVFDVKEKAMNIMILKAKFLFNKKNQNSYKIEQHSEQHLQQQH